MEGTGEFCECSCKCVIRDEVWVLTVEVPLNKMAQIFGFAFPISFSLESRVLVFFPFVYHPTLLSYSACAKKFQF